MAVLKNSDADAQTGIRTKWSHCVDASSDKHGCGWACDIEIAALSTKRDVGCEHFLTLTHSFLQKKVSSKHAG